MARPGAIPSFVAALTLALLAALVPGTSAQPSFIQAQLFTLPLNDLITMPNALGLGPLGARPGAGAGSSEAKSALSDLMKVAPGQKRDSSLAAQGVVAASLLLSSGISITVAGGLGTGYAAMGEALGLINGLAGRVNLGMEYAKAGLSLNEDLVKARQEYGKAFIESGALPEVLDRAAQIRNSLTGNFVPQLQALRNQLLTVRANLATLNSAASAAAALAG